MVILLALLCLLALGQPAQAATINAASCSPTDVQSAVNAAANNDTVMLPTCTYTNWNTTVTIAKPLTVSGQGTANTIIQRARVSANYEVNEMFLIQNVTGFEMRNMTLDGTYDTDPNVWRDMAVVLFTVVDFRIHHMAFTNLAAGVHIRGDPLVQRGLIDHNTFTDIYYNIGTSALGYGVSIVGSGTYPTLALGTAQNIFVEDNTFTRNRHTIALNNGARYVYRYNTIISNRSDGCAIDVHGKWSFARGGRQYEIYTNDLSQVGTPYCAIGRGGDGIIWNNTIPVGLTRTIYLQGEDNCGSTDPARAGDYIANLYIWGNDVEVVSIQGGCVDEYHLNQEYFMTSRPGYTPYQYPHPLQGEPSPPPTVSITTPTTYPSTTVSGATVALAGTAADDIDVTDVTWACTPGCGSGTATGQENWTIASVSLPSNGSTYTITVTATDGTLTGADVLTVTRQDTPDLSGLEARWLLNDGTGSPTAADATGHGYTGTLQGNPTWGTGQSGGALVVDGVDDGMFVNDRMTSPATITLAGWVKATGQIDTYGTVLNIGNAVGIRIQSPGTTRMVQGWYHSASAWVPMTGATGLPDTDWHHVAYTLNATRQVLYLDGVVIGMAAGVAGGPTYMAGDTTSMAGKHTTVEGWDLQGALDDLQVYTRALSEIDITALLAAPPPLTLSINVPTALAAYTSQVTPLAALSGSAEGDDITVTWSCPGCTGSPSGTASYVAPTWTVTNIPLDQDSGNVITVTATDASLNTVDDSLTVTYSPAQQPITNPFGLRLVK